MHFRNISHDEGITHHWCCFNFEGRRNLLDYVEPNIYVNSKSHIRVLTIKDMRLGLGAFYSMTYVWCVNSEVCRMAAVNLLSHISTGFLAPWYSEILPRLTYLKAPEFPEVLK